MNTTNTISAPLAWKQTLEVTVAHVTNTLSPHKNPSARLSNSLSYMPAQHLRQKKTAAAHARLTEAHYICNARLSTARKCQSMQSRPATHVNYSAGRQALWTRTTREAPACPSFKGEQARQDRGVILFCLCDNNCLIYIMCSQEMSSLWAGKKQRLVYP